MRRQKTQQAGVAGAQQTLCLQFPLRQETARVTNILAATPHPGLLRGQSVNHHSVTQRRVALPTTVQRTP
jgi:hypothetical protein